MARNTRLNIASGNDRVAVQSAGGGSSRDSKDGEKDQPSASSGRVTNVCAGNARVGIQGGAINGPVNVQM